MTDVTTLGNNSIEVTSVAKLKLAELSNQVEGKFVRLKVNAGGCKGFSVQLFVDTEQNSDDFKFYNGDMHILSVDVSSAAKVSNAVVDFEENLSGGSFQIKNLPGQGCGCGSSFSGK